MDFWWCLLTNDAMQPFRGRYVPLWGLIGLPTAASCRPWAAAQEKGGKRRAAGCCLAHNSSSKATWRVHQRNPSSCSSWHQAPQAVHTLFVNPEQLGASKVHQTFSLLGREKRVAFLRAVVRMCISRYSVFICFPINLFFAKVFERRLDLQLWLPLDNLMSAQSSLITSGKVSGSKEGFPCNLHIHLKDLALYLQNLQYL